MTAKLGTTGPKFWTEEFVAVHECFGPQLLLQHVDQTPECGLHVVSVEQSKQALPAGLHELTGNANHRCDECAELHLEQTKLFLTTAILPASGFRKAQRQPGFQCPCQRTDQHVRPVRIQIIHRSSQRTWTILQLLDEILLLVTSVTLKYDFRLRRSAIVGDVEQKSLLFKEKFLALDFIDRFANNGHPIRPIAGRQLVIELGHVFALQHEIFVLAVDDDILFDRMSLGSGLGFYIVSRRPFEFFPLRLRPAVPPVFPEKKTLCSRSRT